MKSRSNFPRAVFLLLGLLAAAAAFGQSQTIVTPPLGDYAQEVDKLVVALLIICGVIFVLVVTLAVTFLIKFRAKGSKEDGAPVHGHHVLEIVWTAIPLVIVVVLAFVSVKLVYHQWNPPHDMLVVKVNAYAFDWDFAYYETSKAGNEVEELVSFICGNPNVYVRIKSLETASQHRMKVPVGQPVRFLITSEDVLHSFWVPEFRIKRDALPNYVSDVWITPDRLGTFTIKCAELCGTDHGTMLGILEVVSQEEFDAWIAQEQQA